MKIQEHETGKTGHSTYEGCKMKRLFRRNQIIITTLAVMIAAAGYLNYAGKRDLAAAGNIYEAGMMDISDEDLLAENKAAGDDLWRSEVWIQDSDQVEEALPSEGLAQKEEVGAEAAEQLAEAGENMETETEQLALAEKGGQDAVSEAGDAQDTPQGLKIPRGSAYQRHERGGLHSRSSVKQGAGSSQK